MQKDERWSEIHKEGDRLMETDKSSKISTRVVAWVNDMAGGERKGEMERDIVRSGMRGI